jgi:flagellar assembly protein FliH
LEERLAEETRLAFESGRERGREEGRRTEREAQAPTATAEAERHRRQAAELVENFVRERDRYLQAIEQEVVRLALAVAARILRREAQMDPLLLTGAVRVALGQLAATSEIRLRVPAREADMWRETIIALLPKLTVQPLVVTDERMLLGECVIESKVGTVDLGIRSQLGEIERGFFDRAGTSDAPVRPSQLSTTPETPPVEARA